MVYLFMVLFAAGIVAADQFTKYLTVSNIAPYAGVPAEHLQKLSDGFGVNPEIYGDLPHHTDGISGIFQLSHHHNTGAGWSTLEGQIWLFALIFLIFTAFIIWEFPKKRWPLKSFERWCIVAIYAGGLGNMIDRLRLGFVVDMIDLEFNGFLRFLNGFPIFNVADCFISCGCILLMVHMIFFNKEFWKEEKK